MATAVRDKAFPGVRTQFLNLSIAAFAKASHFWQETTKSAKSCKTSARVRA
jgi:hypothetical protein